MWHRSMCLYDLAHLGGVLQAGFDGISIARLAALKIYFDVVDEGMGRPLRATEDIFMLSRSEITGANDLGSLRASAVSVPQLLAECAQRYTALTALDGDLVSHHGLQPT